jgi:hypothetical protein
MERGGDGGVDGLMAAALVMIWEWRNDRRTEMVNFMMEIM